MNLRSVSPPWLASSILVICMLLCSTGFAQELLSEELAKAELDRLAQLWESQRTEIQTARIEADHFEFHGIGALSKPAVDRFIVTLEAALQADAVAADLQAVTATLPQQQGSKTWGRLLLIVDGSRRRAFETWKWGDGSEGVSDVSFDGETEVQRRSNSNQVNIFKGRTQLHVTGLEDLRVIPRLFGNEPYALERMGENDLFRIYRGSFSMRVYSGSGLVRDYELAKMRTLQYQPGRFSGGIVFPRVTARIRMGADSKLRRIELFRILNAEFNIPIRLDQFEVAIPAQTTVVDVRNSNGSPRLSTATQDSQNAVLAADQNLRRGRNSHLGIEENRWAVPAMVIGLILLGIGAWLVMRKSTHTPVGS